EVARVVQTIEVVIALRQETLRSPERVERGKRFLTMARREVFERVPDGVVRSEGFVAARRWPEDAGAVDERRRECQAQARALLVGGAAEAHGDAPPRVGAVRCHQRALEPVDVLAGEPEIAG